MTSMLAGANDVAGQIVVTSAGTGQSQATATVTVTFTTAYATAPRVAICTTTNDNSIDTGHVEWTVSTTALVMTFSVLPVATKIYKLNYLLVA